MCQGTESGGAGNRFTDIADRAAGRQEVLDVNAGLMLSVRGYPLPPPCPVLGLWAQAGMICGDSSPIDVCGSSARPSSRTRLSDNETYDK